MLAEELQHLRIYRVKVTHNDIRQNLRPVQEIHSRIRCQYHIISASFDDILHKFIRCFSS